MANETSTLEPVSTETTVANEVQQPSFTDEQLYAEIEKRSGRKIASFDELKEPAPLPTEEEKFKAQTTEDKKLLEKHIARGGTIDSFTDLRKIATGDLKELSLTKTKKELIKEGLTEEEAQDEIKSRYHQIEETDLEDLSDDEKASILKKKEIYSNRLFNRAAPEQNNAKAYLESLKSQLLEEQKEFEVDNKLAQEAQVIGKTFNRTVSTTLEIKNGITIPPVETTLSQEDLDEIIGTLGNKEKRTNLLIREDGTENLPLLAELLAYKKLYEQGVKQGAYNALVAATEHTMAKYPQNAQAVYNSPIQTNTQMLGKVTAAKVTMPGG